MSMVDHCSHLHKDCNSVIGDLRHFFRLGQPTMIDLLTIPNKIFLTGQHINHFNQTIQVLYPKTSFLLLKYLSKSFDRSKSSLSNYINNFVAFRLLSFAMESAISRTMLLAFLKDGLVPWESGKGKGDKQLHHWTG